MENPRPTCHRCGAELGFGRYCTNCGQQIVPSGRHAADPGATDPIAADPIAAGPPAVPSAPVQPPPVHQPPPPARFRLFVDSTGEIAATPPPARRRRSGVVAIAIAALCLALLTAAALTLRLNGSEGTERAQTQNTSSALPSAQTSGASGTASTGTPPASIPPEIGSTSAPGDLTANVTVADAAHAPPSRDVATGRSVTYTTSNLLDGQARTAWRVAGAATGTTLTFTLPDQTILASVGLINGYAKTSQVGPTRYDWYLGNRRVLTVRWSFDDGTELTQQLGSTRALQTLELGAVQTNAVRLEILRVSKPGTGPARKNYTAISEVAFDGWSG